MVMAAGSAQAKCDGERGSAARPRAPQKRGGGGETERRRERWRRLFFNLKDGEGENRSWLN